MNRARGVKSVSRKNSIVGGGASSLIPLQAAPRLGAMTLLTTRVCRGAVTSNTPGARTMAPGYTSTGRAITRRLFSASSLRTQLGSRGESTWRRMSGGIRSALPTRSDWRCGGMGATVGRTYQTARAGCRIYRAMGRSRLRRIRVIAVAVVLVEMDRVEVQEALILASMCTEIH